MSERSDFVVVMMTAGSEEAAASMARSVVAEGLAACVSLVPRVRSIYAWEGQVSDETEVLAILKTRADLFGALRDRLRELHDYQTPEVLALPVADGLEAYLSWVVEATRPRTDPALAPAQPPRA